MLVDYIVFTFPSLGSNSNQLNTVNGLGGWEVGGLGGMQRGRGVGRLGGWELGGWGVGRDAERKGGWEMQRESSAMYVSTFCLSLPPRLLPQVILRLNELVWKYNVFPLDRLVLCFVRQRKGGEGGGRRGRGKGESGNERFRLCSPLPRRYEAMRAMMSRRA